MEHRLSRKIAKIAVETLERFARAGIREMMERLFEHCGILESDFETLTRIEDVRFRRKWHYAKLDEGWMGHCT